MKIKPLVTEKSLGEAKLGRYTFLVDVGLTKYQVKHLVEYTFGVSVDKVRTSSSKALNKKDIRGKKKGVKAQKRATVTLKGKDKIDLFDDKK